MARRPVILPRAVRDIDEQIRYFVLHASARTAIRFKDAVRATIQAILDMPELGAPWESDSPQLQGLRYRMMKRFKHHVIFYRMTDDTIEIQRIVRGSRNLEQLLQETDED